MRYKRGESGNKKGRPKGATNHLTRTFKELVSETIARLQDDKDVNLFEWAKKNPRDFYAIAAKLIPTEITGTIKKVYKVTVSDE